MLAVCNTPCRLRSGDVALSKSSSSLLTPVACCRWYPCRPMWIRLAAPVIASWQSLLPSPSLSISEERMTQPPVRWVEQQQGPPCPSIADLPTGAATLGEHRHSYDTRRTLQPLAIVPATIQHLYPLQAGRAYLCNNQIHRLCCWSRWDPLSDAKIPPGCYLGNSASDN